MLSLFTVEAAFLCNPSVVGDKDPVIKVRLDAFYCTLKTKLVTLPTGVASYIFYNFLCNVVIVLNRVKIRLKVSM